MSAAKDNPANAEPSALLEANELLPLVYEELRRLAASRMARESPGHTLQPTALVHEAWLRLAQGGAQFQNRAHFFGAAARAMRQILVDRARRKQTLKRDGGQQIDDPEFEIVAPAKDDELLAVHDALKNLAAEDKESADLVELRYFVGLTVEEIAEVRGTSPATVNRDWKYAKAKLLKEITSQRK